jgi:hypothetical protein
MRDSILCGRKYLGWLEVFASRYQIYQRSLVFLIILNYGNIGFDRLKIVFLVLKAKSISLFLQKQFLNYHLQNVAG